MDQKFKILKREASIISELLKSGLEDLRKAGKDHAFYYKSFYSLSMGLERLMKLINHLERPTANPKTLGHKLTDLAQGLNIAFATGSIENSILQFLSDFSNGNRYTIVDYLFDNNANHLAKEPIVSFYKNVLQRILAEHPIKQTKQTSNVQEEVLVLLVNEDLSLTETINNLIEHNGRIEHAIKYSVMYMGRIIGPFIKRINSHDGNPNPHFSEFFRSLPCNDDPFYLNRKTFRV